MADATKQIMLFGVVGAGAYVAYEYYRYSSAINTGSGGNATTIASVEAQLPFFTFLMMNFSPTSGTAAQQTLYNQIQSILSGQATTASTPQPGTTSTSQPTSVSAAPPSTPAPLPPAPPAKTSIVNARRGMASQLEAAISMTTANADQWNYAYNQVTGQGADARYGFNFDAVYGPVVNGARSSGTMSADVFLQMASGASGGSGSRRGLGFIANFPGARFSTVGNMLYLVHHPFPYSPTYNLKGVGLGAVTQATGFEKALFTNQRLRSNRIR